VLIALEREVRAELAGAEEATEAALAFVNEAKLLLSDAESGDGKGKGQGQGQGVNMSEAGSGSGSSDGSDHKARVAEAM